MRVSNGRRKPRSSDEASLKIIEDKVVTGSSKFVKGTESNERPVNRAVAEGRSGKVTRTEREVSDVVESEIKGGSGGVAGSKGAKKEAQADIGKLGWKRIVAMVMVGILSSALIAGVVLGIYYHQVRYPEMGEYVIEGSGIDAINTWVEAINTLDKSTIKGITGEDSYLAKEIDYANNKSYHLDFLKKMVGTVSYTPNKIEALNKYGNILVDENNKVVYIDSLVNGEDEKVTLSYIDYTRVPLDEEKIRGLMKEVGLSLGDVDYSNRLVEVFCRYMLSLEDSELPLVTVSYVPNLVYAGDRYIMTADEDVYLDKELFSSEGFYGLLLRFSLIAGGEDLKPTKKWTKWNKKSDEYKAEHAEPNKYSSLDLISANWCGSYYLLNEYSITDDNGNKVLSPIIAQLGDGSIENPASLNTDVITSVVIEKKNKNGKIKRSEYPIRVRLVDYKVSQDAIDYFEGKDERNRGFDIKSEIQYTAYTMEVTNLSDKEITIKDNSSLCDELANMAHRTGRIYGLNEEVTLKPQETGIIESWGCSTELNKKYLVWGKNFQRELDVVWFRVLAGDIDDPSEDKGVALNTSRYDEEEEEVE